MYRTKKPYLYFISMTIICISFQNCGPQFELAKDLSNSTSQNTDLPSNGDDDGNNDGGGDGPTIDGKALYATNCSACHGSLASSVKSNRTENQIKSALVDVSQMTFLQKYLSEADIKAIAAALDKRTTVAGNPFKCSNDKAQSADPIRRLSKEEYVNTVRDLFAGAITLAEIQTQVNQFPTDVGDDNNKFDRGVRVMNSGIFNSQISIAEKIGELIQANQTKRNLIFSEACFSAADPTDACLNSFLQRFGKRALRRPLDAKDLEILRAAYRIGDNHAERANLLIQALLSHPSFIYHTEYNGTVVTTGGSVYNISAYELAARLSYLVTGSSPDATLMAKADDGTILTTSVLTQEMNRLLNTNKAKTSFRRFYSKYLVVDDLKFPSYSSSFLDSISTTNLNENAVEEILSLTDFVTFKNRPLKDLMTTRTAFVKTQNIASIYGISVSTATDGATTLPNNYSGVLSRAAFLLSGGNSTSPIHRGYVIRHSILCDNIPSPDPSTLPEGSLVHPPLDPNLTTRERWAQKTSSSTCMGCHSQINPLGFALEGFDSLGRARTQESLFDADGNFIKRLPVDTSVIPEIMMPNETPINGALELAEKIADSQKFNACFVKKWHEFGMRKVLDDKENQCMAADLYDILTKTNGTPLEMIKGLITHPNFRQKKQAL